MNQEMDKRRLKPAATGSPRSPREKHHRLPRESYRGQIAVAFALCFAAKSPLFTNSEVVREFIMLLRLCVEKHRCIVPIYCFMPDHLHVILWGTIDTADLWQAIVEFKQRTGFWLGQHRPGISWQKDFYDHIIRKDEDLGAHVRYIAGNPVRKGLVVDWRQHLHTGSTGTDLEAVIGSTITL
jgi:putative transposase